MDHTILVYITIRNDVRFHEANSSRTCWCNSIFKLFWNIFFISYFVCASHLQPQHAYEFYIWCKLFFQDFLNNCDISHENIGNVFHRAEIDIQLASLSCRMHFNEPLVPYVSLKCQRSLTSIRKSLKNWFYMEID